MDKLRVAIYARVSSKDKGQDNANQLDELREFITRKKKEGWVASGEYIDKASGKNSDRPAFTKLFQDASTRKFDICLFWSLDRFSREGVGATVRLLERLKGFGVDWFSLKEEYLRSIGPFMDVVISVLATIAKQERIRISERTIAGLKRAKKAGVKLGRPASTVDIKKIQRMRKAGKSIRTIAHALGISSSYVGKITKVQQGI